MIPTWTMAGVLPPVRPGQPGNSADRSPYHVSLCSLIEHFCFSPNRMAILQGLLDYRAALHRLGLISGFQWLNGSFLEDIETLESRPPKDIDVVTYFYLPSGETQRTLHAKSGNLFTNRYVKATYKVDAYPYVLGSTVDANQVRQISYWYSMWSHRRNGIWKGFLQIDLDPKEDSQAIELLNATPVGGAAP